MSYYRLNILIDFIGAKASIKGAKMLCTLMSRLRRLVLILLEAPLALSLVSALFKSLLILRITN
jgi:hypothetical protein